MIRIWHSTETFADYIIQNTELVGHTCEKAKLFESDANNSKNFHKMPDHIKKILYLDAPDIIIEINGEPILSIEVSQEAGTGHNVFQRFARLAASVENNVPTLYVYPEAILVTRRGASAKWDTLNPLIFRALEKMIRIYKIPALLYYFPTHYIKGGKTDFEHKGKILDSSFRGCPDSSHSEMQSMFEAINLILRHAIKNRPKDELINERTIDSRRDWMQS